MRSEPGSSNLGARSIGDYPARIRPIMGRGACRPLSLSYDRPVKISRALCLFAGLLFPACDEDEPPAPPIEMTGGGSMPPSGGVSQGGTNSGGTNSGGTNSTTQSGTVEPDTDSDPTMGSADGTAGDTFDTVSDTLETDSAGTGGATATATGSATDFTASNTDISVSLSDSDFSATDVSAGVLEGNGDR